MGKTITVKQDSLITLKENLNEFMVGTNNVSHTLVCVNETSPEVDETKTEAFKAWFGDWENIDRDDFWYNEEISKVVDNNLRPKVVKHGTPYKFDKFDETKFGSTTDPGWLGTGFYFYGDNDIYASQYAGVNGNVMECYLNIRNPYLATSEDMDRLSELNSKEASDEFREELINEEYDGVFYNGDLNEEWVAFYSDQIRKVGSFVNNINEAAPEVDEFELGQESDNPPVGGNYAHVEENLDLNVNSSDIDLSSFKKKDELVPNIWENGFLNSRIRLKLLDIADDFWKSVNLTWVEPKGVILTGSICNFNWSKFSDIDLHLIVDFNEIDDKTEFVRDYLDAKKNQWNDEHEGLRIMGFNVEVYVQNLDEMPQSGGIYDLEENDWLKMPSKDDIKPIGLNKFSIKDKAAKIMTIIDDMYNTLNNTTDSYEIEQIGDDANYLWKKVKNMRKSSLGKYGESGNGNIVYKILRRTDYLNKLWKLSTIVYDRRNSIDESINKPSEDEYYLAKRYIDDVRSNEEYDYYKDIIDRYEEDDRIYDKLLGLSVDQHLDGLDTNSEYLLTNGKVVALHYHDSVKEVGLNKQELLERGNIRIIGGSYSNYFYIELATCPNDIQERKLLYYISTCNGNVYVDITKNRELKKNFAFDRKTFSPELIMGNIKNYFNGVTESAKKYLTLLKEEWVGDGNSEHNPYKERWDAERKALKDFVSNYGKLMQSRENGKLYKVYYDKVLSELIGYNYCICIQWDSVEMKPKSVLYIRALDKFTPNIKQVNFDTRGRDNMRGTYDDLNTMQPQQYQ